VLKLLVFQYQTKTLISLHWIENVENISNLM